MKETNTIFSSQLIKHLYCLLDVDKQIDEPGKHSSSNTKQREQDKFLQLSPISTNTHTHPLLSFHKKNLGVRGMVDKLIASEMKRMPKPRDASSLGFPDIDLFSSNTLIQQELDRVRRGKPMDPALDLSRYQLDPPTSSTSTTSNATAANGSTETITPSASEELPEGRAQWLKALDNANTQLEHQNQRVLNLELVQKFGGNAWNIHNYQLEYDVSLLRKAVDEKKAEIMELNKLRKRDQVKPQGRRRGGLLCMSFEVCNKFFFFCILSIHTDAFLSFIFLGCVQ